MNPIRLVARPLLASTFVYGGIQALRNTSALAEASKPVNDEIRDLAGKVAPQLPVPEDDKTLVRINAGVHILAGLGAGHRPRPAALGARARRDGGADHAGRSPLLGGEGQGRPHPADHPVLQERVDVRRPRPRRPRHRGRPGVAWRAQHAVGSAKREAKHLRKEAKAQARLAAKTVRS